MNRSQNFSSRLCMTLSSIPVRFITLFIVSVALHSYGANGTAYYFDVNGATAGFGSPAGTYSIKTGTNWSTSNTGTAATAVLPTGSNPQMTFGNASTDFPSATFTISLDNATWPWTPWGGLLINSNSATITMNGVENDYLSGDQTWTVAGGSTFNEAASWPSGNGGTGLNFNDINVTLNSSGSGNATINFNTMVGLNSTKTITQNGSNLVVNLNISGSGTQGTEKQASYTLTNGSLNFHVNNAFNRMRSADGAKLTLNGGTIDNTSGSAMTLDLYQGTYVISNSFTFTGTNDLNFGTFAVALTTATPTITVSNSTLTIGGVVSGGFGLTKAGSGTLTLNGTNTYNGAAGTTVNAGVLQAGNTQAFGNFGNAVTVNNGGTIDINGIDLRGYTSNITINGQLDANNGAIINSDVAQLNAIRQIALGSDAYIGNNGHRWDIGRGYTGAVRVTGNNHTLYKIGTDTISLLAQATTLTALVINGGYIQFEDNASFGTAPVTVNSGAFLLSWGALSITNALTMNNGNMNADGAGGSTFGGTMSLTNTNYFGNSGGFSGNSFTISGVISGTGAMTKQGTGALILLTATNTYQGGTTINAGTMQIGDGTNIPSFNASAFGTGTVTINSGTLFLNPKGTPGGTTFNFANSFSVNGGTIRSEDEKPHLGTGGGATFAIGASGATLQATWTNKDLYIDGIMSGSAGLALGHGPTGGTVAAIHLTNGANTYSGTATVTPSAQNVFLDLDNNTALSSGTVSLASGGGGTSYLLLNTTGTTTINGLTGSAGIVEPATGAGTYTLDVDNNINNTFGGVLQNNTQVLNLTKTNTGTLTLTGANTYTGTTTISNGTLKAQTVAFSTTPRTWSIGSGAVLNIDGNTDVPTGTTILNGTGTLRITGGTFTASAGSKAITMSLGSGGQIDVQSGATLVNGGWQDITWTSNLADLNVDGTFNLWDGSAVTVDALSGAGTVDNNPSGASVAETMTIGAANGTGTFSGAIKNTKSTTALTKNGTGTQTLSGTNTYTGATTVSAGTLIVTGVLAAGSAVGVTGTLGGTGTVNGAITVNNTGTIAPGTGGTTIGTLHTAGVTFNATSTYSVDLDGGGPTCDQISSSSTVALGAGSAALTVASIANSANGKVYTIITATTSVTGTFSGLADNSTFVVSDRLLRINYNAGPKTVTLTDVSTGPNAAWSQTGLGQINGGAIAQTEIFLGTSNPNALLFRNLSNGSEAHAPYSTASGCGMPTYSYIGGAYVILAASGSNVVGVNDDGTQHFAATAIGAGAGTPYICPDNTNFFVTYTGNISKRALATGAKTAGWNDKAVTNLSTPADIVVYSDFIYMATTTNGTVIKADAGDATTISTYAPASLTGFGITLPLLVSSKTLYVTPSNGTLHSVATSDMSTATVVTYAPAANNSGPAFSDIDITSDTVYTAAGVNVYQIKDVAGGQKNTYAALGTVNSGPLPCNNSVYFGANAVATNGYYYALNKANFTLRNTTVIWPYNRVTGDATSGPWIDFTNSHVIFGSTGGNLTAFALEP